MKRSKIETQCLNLHFKSSFTPNFRKCCSFAVLDHLLFMKDQINRPIREILLDSESMPIKQGLCHGPIKELILLASHYQKLQEMADVDVFKDVSSVCLVFGSVGAPKEIYIINFDGDIVLEDMPTVTSVCAKICKKLIRMMNPLSDKLFSKRTARTVCHLMVRKPRESIFTDAISVKPKFKFKNIACFLNVSHVCDLELPEDSNELIDSLGNDEDYVWCHVDQTLKGMSSSS
eukprot:TRINITY_DN778462_c0_g1_i1.p1 TRINITY_DN778462_c0_g1~~TRINITY_DN778462_c0_g1_i1.p1  ORF type:complete len:232 (-),score=33.47 TRINITY_DN778462_c0_g1_i1:123-818(-)